MKNIIRTIVILFTMVISTGSIGQGPPPPNGNQNPEGNNTLVGESIPGGGESGGGAPIGSGIGILLALGAAYTGRRYYLQTKESND